MRSRLSAVIPVALLASASWSPAASGQPYEPPAPASLDDSGPTPAFSLLDRTSGESKIHVGFGYTFFDEDNGLLGNDLSSQRVDVHGQYVDPVTGFGGYGVLTYGRISANDVSEDALGNIEIGGLYQLRGEVPVTLRAGLALETADDEDALIVAFSGFHRLGDILVNNPDTTTLRFAASPILRQGQTFFRIDAGLDVPLSDSDTFDVDALGRLNFGLGIDLGQAALQAELINLIALGDLGGDDDLSDRLIHLVGLGGRFTGHPVIQPGLTIAIPVDEDFRDFVQFILLFNAEIVLPH